MKRNLKKAMLAIAVLLVGSASVNAKSWRVNPNPNMKANFTDINTAMASADVVAGDTIYLDPGTTITTEQTISKQVVVVGTGYFFTDQPHNEAKIAAALNITADNAKVEGLYITGETRVKASYVTLERCRMGGTIYGNKATCVNATIRQCYTNNGMSGYGKTDVRSANWLVENCYLGGSADHNIISNLFSATFKNCYVHNWNSYTSQRSYAECFANCDNLTLVNSVVNSSRYKNHILYSCGSYTCVGNVFSCAETDLPTLVETNVFLNTTDLEATVFDTSKPNDLWLELREDSPAKGVGVDGVDAGPRGGLTPYVFSGYPQGRPYFKAATVSPVAKDGKVSVKLNLKMQDE